MKKIIATAITALAIGAMTAGAELLNGVEVDPARRQSGAEVVGQLRAIDPPGAEAYQDFDFPAANG